MDCMAHLKNDIPLPDLRIVNTRNLLAHEEHDSQRAHPLIERLRTEHTVINPPIVAPIDEENYVVLDGANRYYAFSQLEYPHILVQVIPYNSDIVELYTWRHVICNWDSQPLLERLREMSEVKLADGHTHQAVMHIILKDTRTIAILTPGAIFAEANVVLNKIVQIYQRNAILHRTAVASNEEVWENYPDGIAIIDFPHYHTDDVIQAATQKAYLPPGITRHIIHGRALRVNYPLDFLRDSKMNLQEKNQQLKQWLQSKHANRQVRYYGEATYQFDE